VITASTDAVRPQIHPAAVPLTVAALPARSVGAISPASRPPRVVGVTDHAELAGLSPATVNLTDLDHPLLGHEYHASLCVVGAAATIVMHDLDGRRSRAQIGENSQHTT